MHLIQTCIFTEAVLGSSGNVRFLFFVWGRVLELGCHFETGNVKNHSCVPVGLHNVCSLGYSVILWLRGKPTRIQRLFFGYHNLVQFIFFSLVMSFADIWLVWMRWVCEAASWSWKGCWAWVMSGWSRKGRGVESFSIPTRAQGWMGRVRVWRATWLTPSPEACWGCIPPFCFPLCKGGVYRWEHCTSARVVAGQQGVETQNAVGWGSLPYTLQIIAVHALTQARSCVCIPAVTVTGNTGRVETMTP